MRKIVLDTETTGLEPSQGHRIVEIGCVEVIDRQLTGNHYHQYINPDREVEEGAIEVHGLSNDFLAVPPIPPQFNIRASEISRPISKITGVLIENVP